MKNQAKRRPDRFKATNSATSKLTLRVTFSAARQGFEDMREHRCPPGENRV
jgi:hypothetical protein